MIGYGDLSPTTATGKIVAILLTHLTALLVMPLLTAEIAAKLIVDGGAFTRDEQEELKGSRSRLAAKVGALTQASGRAESLRRGPPATEDLQ